MVTTAMMVSSCFSGPGLTRRPWASAVIAQDLLSRLFPATGWCRAWCPGASRPAPARCARTVEDRWRGLRAREVSGRPDAEEVYPTRQAVRARRASPGSCRGGGRCIDWSSPATSSTAGGGPARRALTGQDPLHEPQTARTAAGRPCRYRPRRPGPCSAARYRCSACRALALLLSFAAPASAERRDGRALPAASGARAVRGPCAPLRPRASRVTSRRMAGNGCERSGPTVRFSGGVAGRGVVSHRGRSDLHL